MLREASEYKEDEVNPLYLCDIWLELSRAFRIHDESRRSNEFTLRRGIDSLLSFVEERRFGKTPSLRLL